MRWAIDGWSGRVGVPYEVAMEGIVARPEVGGRQEVDGAGGDGGELGAAGAEGEVAQQLARGPCGQFSATSKDFYL